MLGGDRGLMPHLKIGGKCLHGEGGGVYMSRNNPGIPIGAKSNGKV